MNEAAVAAVQSEVKALVADLAPSARAGARVRGHVIEAPPPRTPSLTRAASFVPSPLPRRNRYISTLLGAIDTLI